ncbi:putative exonuclease GOR [Lutzomyia longipalpis]|uniref:putative exonuclease GOR n=1 Tax=Lutzomyia longipalpis TaxID=7200 RepID=UPI002483F799|nr:putative exonuclease GOR [Lutzomyia longipalpis]
MLPSTGLFKSINCPFFSATDSCSRPFCHFKHVRKDDNKATPPVYTPSQKKEAPGVEEQEPVPKKAKLEYVPHSISTKAVMNDHPAPSYIPSVSVLKKTNPAEISLEEIDEELNLISDILQDVESNGDVQQEHVVTYKPSKIVEVNAATKCSEKENIEKTQEKEKVVKEAKEKPVEDVEKKEKPPEEKKHKSSRSNSHRSHSSSKSKHHSSSKSSSKSSSSSHKSSSKSRESDHKSSHRSSSKHRHSSSSSSKSSKTSSASKKSEKTSSSKSEKSSSSKNTQSESARLQEFDLLAALEAESSDEDDIEAQCKMIFEEFTAQESTEGRTSDKPPLLEKKPEPEAPELHEEHAKKKRIAHENAQKRPSLLPAPPKRVNHIQTALHSVYQRQELVRKQLEVTKEQEKVEAPLKSPPLSPGNPANFARRIAPVSNTVALINAKKRIEELRQQRTVAQTASKAGKRIAHANPALLTEKPAPPVLEPTATKISYNLRMQYYNIMVKHCVQIYPNCEDGWQRAQTEELAVFKKCSNPMIYKSSASLVVNKLRKESIEAGSRQTERNNTVSHDVILAGKSGQKNSWSINKTRSETASGGNSFDTIASTKAYNLAAECALTEEQLKENGYPRAGKCKGQATICKTYQKHHLSPPNPDERFCSRCSKLFNIACYDRPGVDECNYHPKSTGFRRGFADNLHRCCQQAAGTPGCMYANYHVSDQVDYENLTGFVTTISRDEKYVCTRKDIFALDCEMCYTTEGLELTRVTVVDVDSKVVYDALVKPDNRIIDYNTTYSGITEAMLAKETRTLRQVQAVLLSMFHSRTILVGHSLESDLSALKMIHSLVVDTSILYPHKMGPPKKRALKTLCIENLKRIIQENESGHDSAEDAEVCIQLLKHYLRNRIT